MKKVILISELHPTIEDLDSYQELIQFQEQTGDPSMIDILQKDDGSPLVTSFEKTYCLQRLDPTDGGYSDKTMDDFLANDDTIINEINERKMTLPIPTLASGAPGEVTSLSATPGKEQIILGWSDPEDANFDHVEISWMANGGTSSEPVSVPMGKETFTVTNLDGDVLYIFTIVTSDSEGNTSAGVRISETPSPDMPPTINPITDKEVQAGGSSITVNIMATDPDAGQTPTITYSPALDYATFRDNRDGTATLEFSPGPEIAPATPRITITASSGDLTATKTFTLTITPPDNPPMITAIDDQMVQAGGSSITVNIMATDPDAGQTPTITYSPALDYARLTPTVPGTATLVFNPDGDVDPVVTTITITASSGDLTAIETFTLTITPPDNPPMITAIEDQMVQAGGSSITVNIMATDSDAGQTPTITYSPALGYATFRDNRDGTATLEFSPGPEIAPATPRITITASSGDLTAIETFTLTITASAVDNPPTITTIENQSVQAGGSPITVNIMATDSDAGQTPTITYSPALDYARLTSTGPGTATLVFNPDGDVDPVVTNITITASSGDLTAIETFTLTITPPDNPPMITAIEDQSVQAGGNSITVNIIATDPDEGQTPSLSYSPALPYATLNPTGEGAADLILNPGRDVSSGTTNITITATSDGLTDSETFILTIAAPADRPPTVTITPPLTGIQTVQLGESLRVSITATDPDEGQIPMIFADGTATLTSTGPGTADFVFTADREVWAARIPPMGLNFTITIRALSGRMIDVILLNIFIPPPPPDADNDGVSDTLDVDDDNDGLIEINTLEDLHNIRYNLAGTSYKTSAIDAGNMNGAPGSGLKGYELVRGLDFADPTSYSNGMVNSAWTTGSGWLPIGNNRTDNDSTRFGGILEGNGHKITNLMIRRDTEYVGLFGYISSEGEVRNLGLENAVADYTGNSSGSFNFIGILAGVSRGTIIAVHTSGMAIGSAADQEIVGGLVGWNGGTITASYATGNADGGDGDVDLVGGLVGGNGGTITACHATGNADGGNGNLDSVGGLVGENDGGTITNCHATGNADGGDGDDDNVGGLVGWNFEGTITACHATGMANGGDGDDDRVGGLVGADIGTITNCHATGMANGGDGDDDLVGGLVGENSGTITACHATGNADGGDGDVDLVGGLVGENSGTITACHATGNADGGNGLDGVGGLVGQNDGGTITACHATGMAIGSAADQEIVGGLVGANSGTITACHATGNADGGDGDVDLVGGLVGQNSGTITASYATGNADGGNGLDGVGGLVGVNSGTITASYATGNADGGDGDDDIVGGLVGGNVGTITASYATGTANGGDGDDDLVGGLVGQNDGGTITASYGFGTVMGGETPGVNRSGDASATVTNASALTMANSSVNEANRWPARVWDFGTDSQVPVLKWITGYNSSGTTDEAKYPCDVALLPAGRKCGEIIPGQVR